MASCGARPRLSRVSGTEETTTVTTRDRLRRIGGRLLLLLLGPALLLGLLELGLRLAGYGYDTHLFLPVPAAGTYGANQDFGLRFFPRGIVRRPVPQAFALEEAPKTCRVFTLGASAALGVPSAAFSFSRILQVMLEARYPGVHFEFVNTAITAINSHVVLPIARECESYAPDVYLIYLGNNEVIGPYGIGSDVYGRATSLRLIRLGIALRTTKIGQLLQAITGKLSGQDRILEKWGGMALFSENTVRADDPRLSVVQGHFRQNLHDICRAGLDGGAGVVLSTVAVNVKDSAPFASLHRPDLNDADLARWQTAFDAGRAAQDAGDLVQARARYEAAAAIDDEYADLRYRLGHVALALGDTATAAAHLQAALAWDGLRFRTDRRFDDTIRATAADFAGADLRLADARAFLAAHEPTGTGLPGSELFYEHVHLKFTGNYLVALALLPAVRDVLPAWVKAHEDTAADVPDIDACARALLLTPWNEYNSLNQIRSMATKYPFTDQSDHDAHMAAMDRRLQELRATATPEVQRETYIAYRAAYERDPHDLLVAFNYFDLLRQAGMADDAARVWDGIVDTQPQAANLSLEHALGQ